jgi:D-serine dehydratase
MLIRLAATDNRPLSVRDVGLDNCTEADGLAVGQASEFVAPVMSSLLSGVFTVPDCDLFEDLYLLATHILWTTGGALVPDEEYRQFHERGRIVLTVQQPWTATRA